MDEDFKKNLKNSIKKDFFFIPKLSLSDKIKNLKKSWKHLKQNGVFNKKSYCSLKEAIERQVCCTTCTDTTKCPYCGCFIKIKKLLNTENCPSLQAYPHLRKCPPKNYWSVVKEKTSVLIPSRNEKYLNRTIENLIETATGEIEILVGMDGWDFDYEVIKNDRIKVFKEEIPIGRRALHNKLAEKATGKYLFKIDAHSIMDLGWDTKLKCICDPNTIIGCCVSPIKEESWKLSERKWMGCKIDEEVNFSWDIKDYNKCKKIEEVLSFPAGAWMIQKETFWKFEGNNLLLGKWGYEEAEWTLNIRLTGGKIFIRKDVNHGHLFRKKFPYKVTDCIDESRKILKQLWWGNHNKNQIMTIKEVVDQFKK